MWNTGCSRCAELMARCRSAGLRSLTPFFDLAVDLFPLFGVLKRNFSAQTDKKQQEAGGRRHRLGGGERRR
jgi:hypothetical protein